MARRHGGLKVLDHPLIAPFVIITIILFLIWIVAKIFETLQISNTSPLYNAFNTVSQAFGTVAGIVVAALIATVGIYVLILLIKSLRGGSE